MNTGSAEVGALEHILFIVSMIFRFSDDDTREFNNRFHANF